METPSLSWSRFRRATSKKFFTKPIDFCGKVWYNIYVKERKVKQMKVVSNSTDFRQCVFGDLCIGDCFRDKDGDLSIKTDNDSYIYTTDNEYWDKCLAHSKEIVTPLEATLTV